MTFLTIRYHSFLLIPIAATSKCTSIEDLGRITTYGFRGEAVAAVTEMALVDIVSRPRFQEQAHSVIFKGGDKLFCGQSNKFPRFHHGTTVSVRDLFYKFPVRQRYWSEATHAKVDFEVDRVKRAVETLALINPEVTFTMIDVAKSAKVFVCKKADLHQRIGSVLGQALSLGLTHVRSSPSTDAVYSLSGYISTQGHYNRSQQYVFLNNRPIVNESLPKIIAQLFHQSSFSKDSRQQSDTDLRRSRERHPVFVLMLRCPGTEYDICADPSKVMVEFKDEERMMKVVRETVITFLEQHHFLSKAIAASLRIQTSTKKRQRRLTTHLKDLSTSLAHMARVKSSQMSRTGQSTKELYGHTGGGEPWMDRLTWEEELDFELDHDWVAAMLDDDFEDQIEYERQGSQAVMIPAADYQRFERKSSSGTKPFKPGTSSIWAQDALRKWSNPVFETAPTPIQSLQIDLGLWDAHHGDRGGSGPGASTSRFFKSAEGQPGFVDVRSLQLSKELLRQARVVAQLDSKFILCVMQATSRSSSRSMQALVVVDQHAADERVRVEKLMQEMCLCSQPGLDTGSDTHQLDSMTMVPPLDITLTKREWYVAAAHSGWLARWGFVIECGGSGLRDGTEGNSGDDDDEVMVSHHFQSQSDTSGPFGGPPKRSLSRSYATSSIESDYIRGQVLALPRVVADRCVVDSALTHDLVKDALSTAEESGRVISSFAADSANEASSWLRCIRGCPRGILDIVNSKACRGAIMFNDELTLAQCKQVIQNLGQCTFPFQCAHGRPSIVPLTAIGEGSGSNLQEQQQFVTGNREYARQQKRRRACSDWTQWRHD
ncbi:DNA mismatch repair protein [Mortierella antarctica]|nr:DNA mismatch repair protein [Mortierella antarctica]